MKDTALMYLGAFAPEGAASKGSATSTAAVIFQSDFLDALCSSDLPTPTVRCYYPIASFPKSRRLLCLPESSALSNGLHVRSLAHINLGALKILTLGLSAAWATLVWALCNRARRRVVISYNLNAPPAAFIGPVCRLLGVKYVPFIGDIYVPGEVVRDSWLRRIEYAAQRRAIPRADGLLVCNKAIIDDFAPGNRFLLVEGGVRERFVRSFHQRPRQDGAFQIVFAGQLSELNGVKLLLDAMKLIDDEEVRVSVMGGGALESEVRRAAERDPRISFLGLVSRERVVSEYAGADLLLNLRSTAFQTQRYVFPSKVVECLATGVPLLSTRTGHVEDEFGQFVFLLHEQTPESLASEVLRIKRLSVEDRARIGRRAQAHVLASKTWERKVEMIGTYIEESVFGREAAA